MILFYLLISVMPLMRHPFWDAVVGSLTMMKVLGAACMLYSLVVLASARRRPRFFATPQAIWFFALIAVVAVSSILYSRPDNWLLSPTMSYASFLLFFFVTIVCVNSLKRLRWSLLVALGSVAFGSLYVIREWQKYHGANVEFRPGWVVGDPNYFTVSAVLCLPVAFYFMRRNHPRWIRLYCLGCMVITIAGIDLAASRGGFLGLVSAFVLLALRSKRPGRNIGALALLMVMMILAPRSPVMRLMDPSRSDTFAVDQRMGLWKAGLRMSLRHPIMGVGLGNFKQVVLSYSTTANLHEHVAHNSYVEILSEMGLPGIIAFLGMMFSAMLNLEKVRRAAKKTQQLILWQAAESMQAGLIGACLAIFFVSGQYQKLVWLFLFLSMCLPALYKPEVKPVAAPATEKAQEEENAGEVVGTWETVPDSYANEW